jgi:hypothetical protein
MLFKYIFKEEEAIVLKCEALKRNFRKVEAFLNYNEDFIKITKLFEDISREMKASFPNLNLL